MPDKPKDYVSSFQGMGGRINTMDRFEEMNRRATGAAAPAPAPAAPAAAKPKAAAPKPTAEKMSIDALIRAIRQTVADAGALLPGGE